MPGGSAFLQVMPAAGVDGGADPSGVPLGDREGNEGLLVVVGILPFLLRLSEGGDSGSQAFHAGGGGEAHPLGDAVGRNRAVGRGEQLHAVPLMGFLPAAELDPGHSGKMVGDIL